MDGLLRRVVGACCDSARATAGGRCAGGWDSEELILLYYELDDRFESCEIVQFVETELLEAVKSQVVLGSCLQDGKLSGRRPKYPIAPPSNSNCTPRFGGGAFVSPRQLPSRQLSTAKSELLLTSLDG